MKMLFAGVTVVLMALQSVGPAAAASSDAAYLIAQIQITEEKAFFEEYGASVGPLLAKAGANVLVAAPSPQVLEGEWDANWIVVLQFPSEQALLGWYQSDEYQSVVRCGCKTHR